ncbi:MAG: class I SAM-dependent methyltransferase, partial [Pirellula sp.]
MASFFSAETQLNSIRDLLKSVAEPLDLNVSVRLWNGEVIPLGANADGKFIISLSGPGVIGSMMRRPTLEMLVRLYATGHIDFEGGDLIDFSEALKTKQSNRARLKKISKIMLAKKTLPFLFAKTDVADLKDGFRDDMVGRDESKRKNTDYIQFHYDVGNEFYKLFLGSEMVYTCAYFK